jgi:putative copper export protein
VTDAIDVSASAVQFAYYVSALLVIGLLLHGALKVTAIGFASAPVVLSLIVALLYAARLLVANAKLGGSLDAVGNTDTFLWVWRAHREQALAVAAGCLLAAGGALLRRRILMIAAALTLSASFGLAGHTRGLEAPGAFPWLSAVHVLIAGYWFAAPVTLWPSAKRPVEELTRRLRLFSETAQIAVPLLFIAGMILAWRLSGGWNGLDGSSYGRLLLVKLIFVSLALALGAANKIWVTNQIRLTPARGMAALRLTLSAEFLAFLAAAAAIAIATTAQGPEEL